MATNFEVRLLLVLWDLGGAQVKKGDLNGRFSGRTAEARESCTNLIAVGAIEASTNGNLLTLTDAGKSLLSESLAGNEFSFKAQIGAKMADALLKWMRSNPVSAAPVEKAAGSTIGSYEAFKVVALETFDRLNRDFNMDNLVPIYRIRREIGDRVERSEFSTWLFEMQSEDIFQLLESSVEDCTSDKLEDSVTTKLGKLRCYVKRLAK
jgi:hypothetical protein